MFVGYNMYTSHCTHFTYSALARSQYVYTCRRPNVGGGGHVPRCPSVHMNIKITFFFNIICHHYKNAIYFYVHASFSSSYKLKIERKKCISIPYIIKRVCVCV